MLALATGCQKTDTNGPLDGMWQLTSLEDLGRHETLLDKHDSIYWHFKLQLMKAEKIGYQPFLNTFRHAGDSLFVLEARKRPFDTLVGAAVPTMAPDPDVEGGQTVVHGFAALRHLGFPLNGKFRVEALSDDRMILSCGDSLLTFRKY